LGKAAVAAPHLAALGIMATTEYAVERWLAFFLTWVLLNCVALALLRRPAVSGAVALAVVRRARPFIGA
jgi:hypothetical protein